MSDEDCLLKKMSLAVANQNIREVLILSQDFSSQMLERLNRECLSPEQQIWLDKLLAQWHRWNKKNPDYP